MRLIIFFLFFPSFCFPQQKINAERFFALGLSRFKQIKKPVGENLNFPWFDKYEFRTETSDFDLNKQEYTIRLSPSTAKIRKAQKAFYDELRNVPDFEGQEIYCDLILLLHIDWLSLFTLGENKRILDELALIIDDKQTLYERMADTYEFDPEKLLKLQMEKSDVEIKLNKIKLERDYLLDKYKLQNQTIDFGEFATVESISTYLADSIFPVENGADYVDQELEYKKQLLQKEIELERSERKRLLDFVQFKYNGPHTDVFQERVSLGLGFQLPTSGNQKLKIQELQIEKEEVIIEAERNMQEKQEKLNQLSNKLKRDIQTFNHSQKIRDEERVELQILGTKISQKEGSSPLILLDIEERHLSIKIKSLQEKEDLLKSYLKYLHQSDKMCQSTFVNYLKQ